MSLLATGQNKLLKKQCALILEIQRIDLGQRKFRYTFSKVNISKLNFHRLIITNRKFSNPFLGCFNFLKNFLAK